MCPREEFTKEQVGQTCLPYIEGIITDPLPDGTGYKVYVSHGTKCDLVAFGKKERPLTSFVACYNGYYEGVARISDPLGAPSALKRAAAAAKRSCNRIRTKGSKRAFNACLAQAMSRSMDARAR